MPGVAPPIPTNRGQIDVSQEKSPEETIQKMQAVKRAALAPADPSSADRSIAASATALESQARQELQSKQANPAQGQTEQQGTSKTNSEVPDQTNEKATPATRRSPALHIVA
jgi:hypothetical protein